MSGLLLDTPLTPEQMTYAKAVKTSGDALLSLIEELLDYSKIEAGKIDLEQRPFALAALIEDITELLAPRAQARKLEIAAYVDERLPIRSGRRRSAAAPGAAQSRGQRHQVHLDRRRGADRRARYLARTKSAFWCATPASASRRKRSERIFREFEQADERIARNYGGTGLGLEHHRAHRQANGRAHHAARASPGTVRHSRCRFRLPPRRCRAKGLRRAGSDRPIDHAGGAANHRGIADRPAAAALGRSDLHRSRTCRWRTRCCRSGRGTPC